jgi:hypothetical protein
MNKNKILFIDSWTRGIHNFVPIANELKNYGWESLLVHRGSWGHDSNRPLEEKIDGILCRDFQYYKTRFIYKVLKVEKPDLVLILTTNYLFDRAVILASKSQGIKSCFMMHGIRGINDIDVQKSTPNDSFFQKRWQRAGKFLFHIIPNYYLSGLSNNWWFLFRVEPYSILLKLFFKPHKYLLFPPPSSEIHCDLALVWGNAYKQFFIKEYGYPENRVTVVGHPPLDPVFHLLNNPPNQQKKIAFLDAHFILVDKPYCVYLADGSVEQGQVGWTIENRIKHLDEIALLCKKASRQLVIKLHPATDKFPIQAHFSEDDHVHVFSKLNLNLLIMWCESVIGQGSTTNDIAIIMQKPLFLPAWGISERKAKSTIKRQPMSILCSSPDELLESIKHPDKDKFAKKQEQEQYILDFITYTDGKAIDRIVENIINAGKIN